MRRETAAVSVAFAAVALVAAGVTLAGARSEPGRLYRAAWALVGAVAEGGARGGLAELPKGEDGAAQDAVRTLARVFDVLGTRSWRLVGIAVAGSEGVVQVAIYAARAERNVALRLRWDLEPGGTWRFRGLLR